MKNIIIIMVGIFLSGCYTLNGTYSGSDIEYNEKGFILGFYNHTTYYENGKIKSISKGFNPFGRESRMTEFYESGNLKREWYKPIFFLKKYFIDKYYYENGNIHYEINNNELIFFKKKSYRKTYYESGEIQQLINYLNKDRLLIKNYYENGSIESEGLTNPKISDNRSRISYPPVGLWKYYDEDGEFLREEDHGEVE